MTGVGKENANLENRPARRRARWGISDRLIAAALAISIAFAIVTTWLLVSPLVEQVDPGFLSAMVVANVLIAAAFASLIAYRLWRMLSARRHQLAGSQTHLQLVGMFALVAVAPSIIAFLFAFTILRTSLNDVFSDRLENTVTAAREFANDYFQDEANAAGINLQQIAGDIITDELTLGLSPQRTPILFRQRLGQQAYARNLAAIVVLDGERNIIARVEMAEGAYDLPPATVFDTVDAAFERGARLSDLGKFDLNNEPAIDMFRTLLKTESFGGGYIISYKFVPPALSSRLRNIRQIRDEWTVVKVRRASVERDFLAGYIVLAIIILSGAVWLGLWAASRIVQPIGRLVGMADRVSRGDLAARVEVHREDGELGVLARSMNHMTAQLQTQRDDLVETNKQFDRRRRFTEAVLSGVSAGVVGVSAEGRITIANRFAAELLGVDAARLPGARVSEALPELESLLNSISGECHVEVADQIEFARDDRVRTVNVRIVSDQMDGERSLVITFDDITQLISAQRNAAWGDVARRIAHEIKNPLTPIQLSAERLRRKYLHEVKSTPEIFDKCTETIIRHVNDIGRMVDEFSSFARMPKPVIAREDLRELAKSAIFPQRVAAPDIDFAFEAPAEPVWARCDGRLIVQALSNLLKNAAESIAVRIGGDESAARDGRIKVVLSVKGGEARIDVLDNGIGLPKAERHRLTEPYMTTRVKGTGLGLAIVRKVIEEHGGTLRFDDEATLGPSGARVSVILPRDVAASETRPVQAAAE